ncbi:signal transducer and activator of transcription5A [Striga asiatica]|uniref:Signal transducer and activator of transcription5A n=1 Tax=Striga asiatica TaxID=4170 RepID=A0A5A7PKV7_STRAF|nr:signal transducer and activator of transcription5A [Striga asiatica]
MGNAALCAPSIISNGEIRIFSGGKLQIYANTPVRAAEVMLENPGQFLCESENLRVGQRIPGMCADEELQKGRIYFLLPMEMLYSVLTSDEMRALTPHKACKGTSRQPSLTSLSKIFPEFNCLSAGGVGGGQEAAGYSVDGGDGAESGGPVRYSRQRSWQPALETIVETPPRA